MAQPDIRFLGSIMIGGGIVYCRGCGGGVGGKGGGMLDMRIHYQQWTAL